MLTKSRQSKLCRVPVRVELEVNSTVDSYQKVRKFIYLNLRGEIILQSIKIVD